MSREDFTEFDFDDGIDITNDLENKDIFDKVNQDVDIEKVVAAIKKCRSEVEFLKRLKEQRAKPIDSKIEKIIANEGKLSSFILELMPQFFPEKNTVDFPGVGKITKRKTNGKWEITDEVRFKELLKKIGKFDEVVETKETIKKKELPKVAPLILKDEKEETAGIKFEKPEKEFTLVVKIYEQEEEKKEEKPSSEVGF